MLTIISAHILTVTSTATIVNQLGIQIIGPTGMADMIATNSTFGNQIPKVWLIRSEFWFHLAYVCGLAIVAASAGSG